MVTRAATAVAPPRPSRPTRTLSRAATPDDHPGTAAAAAGAATSHGTGGAGGGGGDSDLVYADVMRRVREEQEQLGQLINHPF
jgi:hypothetical protein